MKRLHLKMTVLAVALMTILSGCLFPVEDEDRGDRRGHEEYRDHDRGWNYDRDRGEHGDYQRRGGDEGRGPGGWEYHH